MASVSTSFSFADGDSVGACVEVDGDYPDALAEAVARCTDLLRAAMVLGTAVQTEADPDA